MAHQDRQRQMQTRQLMFALDGTATVQGKVWRHSLPGVADCTLLEGALGFEELLQPR